jgi:hypothetical protein
VYVAARAKLAQHLLAELEVSERHRFRDLQVHLVIVQKDGIVRAHEPAFVQLLRVNVEEQRDAARCRHRELTHGPPQSAAAAGGHGPFEEHRRAHARPRAAHERLVGEGFALIHPDDGLKHDAQLVVAHDIVDRAQRVPRLDLRVSEREAPPASIAWPAGPRIQTVTSATDYTRRPLSRHRLALHRMQ